MFRIPAIIGLLAISACGSTPDSFIYLSPPSSWAGEQREIALSFPTNRLCRLYKTGSYNNHLGQNREIYTSSDYAIIGEELRQRGLSRRDLEIIRDSNADFGTQQTFAGLICSLGAIERVNRSFIAGRHRWQVVTFGGSFIYLEGDGTEAGMRVTGWN